MERTDLHLPRSQPEAQGIHSAAVIAFLNAVQERQLELHSLMLLRHGQVVAEGWWAPYASEIPHMLFSLSKSFTSTAIGIAASEGKLSLEDPIVSFFPDDAPAEIGPNLSIMRVRHLLMMGTGHDQDTTSTMRQNDDGNWAKVFLHIPVEHVPGTHFVYNSGATYMLSAILQKVTGQTLLEYLKPRLFEPLGIEGATWESCPQGINVGGWGLNVTTEDIAKFGQLYLQKGVWNDQRLLLESWVEEATSKQISNGDGGASDWAQGYGYQFWRCRHGVYRGDGAFGQFCIVMPEQDAVLAMTSGTNDLQGVMDAVWNHLLPAMEQSPHSPDEDSQATLAAMLRGLNLNIPQLQPNSPLEAAISGKYYKLEDNEQQWNSVSLTFEDDKVVVVLGNLDNEYRINLGRGEWVEGTTRLMQDENKRVVASFTWQQEDTLLLTMRFIETPFVTTSRIQFVGDEIILNHSSNVLPALAEIRGRLSLN
ncbi:CubicO group peptidase (beta-lactamase class C family) [Paenibacillus castaneae]|uniref:serine hydrolase domain-containing protein n=1 Tax=Paenibacillus castaneae TaxID=474957 RepID=UPI000C9B8D18|nr:serine hydrolase [Paenibacillus castaneae]NIK76683.1 CubicO group peptidase (beta-lactamase class C family) [Paenibacillus castaneae]